MAEPTALAAEPMDALGRGVPVLGATDAPRAHGAARRARPRVVRVALAGSPNAGKSSLFNALTGANQRVGNYPGVTVEKRVGRYGPATARVEVVDLPGTYSLSALSPEERIAEETLSDGGLDVVVVVVEAVALARGLTLLAQVMELGASPVLCLNMSDEATAAGQRLDVARLEARLGIPVVETVGHKRVGVGALTEAIEIVARGPRVARGVDLGGDVASAVERLAERLARRGTRRELALRAALGLLERGAAHGIAAGGAQDEELAAAAGAERAALEAGAGKDLDLLLAERRTSWADAVVRDARITAPRAQARARSRAIDRVIVHRLFGLPIFAAIMYALFWVTFSVGEAPMEWIERGIAALGSLVGGLWPEGASSPLRSLVLDGIFGGVGGVLVFLPNILLLFLGLSLLEDTGYMARAAFLLDRAMHRFGLHGKSFVPLMTGFGCSIPGILATRTLENERDRLTTMLVLPLMSCGARLPIWMLLIPAFFPAHLRAPMLAALYATGIGLALGLALLLRRTLLRGMPAPFVMELPPYRLPTLRAVVRRMLDRAAAYLRKAGTMILAVSVVLWALTTYPRPDELAVDRDLASGRLVLVAPGADRGSFAPETAVTPEEVEHRRMAERLAHSVAGRLGRLLEPALAPLGFDWKLGTAMIGAFAAKEVFVAQMGVVYAMGEADENTADLRDRLRADYPPATGLALMLFLLIATPCMATFAVTRRESGSVRWALLQLVGLTALGYLVAFAVATAGRLVS